MICPNDGTEMHQVKIVSHFFRTNYGIIHIKGVVRMDKLIIGLIGVGTVLLAVGIAVGNSPVAVAGVIFLGVGILIGRLFSGG